MKKEMLIFIVILVILALVQHPDILTNPLERLQSLPKSGAYGLGAFHPVIFAFGAYLFFISIRGIYRGVIKIFSR